ncbi:MAG: peptidylprolyl isomerase [Candidatus Magasanikbacteria bacterium]|nr:peptidylprolyl isomerase [Candidatus Magasanikbacteria bacterium]
MDEQNNQGAEVQKPAEIEQKSMPCCAKLKLANWQIFCLGILSVLILAGLGFLGWVKYSTKQLSENGAVLTTARVLGLSAVKINGLKVAYSDYMDDLGTIKKFYASQSGLPKTTDEQMSDQVISRLMANAVIGDLAREFKVEASDADIAEMKSRLVGQLGSEEDAEKELMEKYGWTLDKYVERVVKPLVLEQKTQEAFAQNTSEEYADYQVPEVRASHILFQVDDAKNDAKVKKQAEAVLKRIKDGEDFAKLAAEFGSDGTKDAGGDLGWFGKGAMVKEFEDAVFTLEKGQLSESLVKTQYGYHIVKVDDKRMAGDFIAFMDNTIKNAKIKFYIPIHDPFDAVKE